MEIEDIIPDWASNLPYAVTVCDADCKIIYMNERSKATFSPDKDIIGTNLMQYHPERAQKMIRHMLETGDTNTYTIRKRGQKKIIHQAPWRDDEGKIAGLVELSIPIPDEMPHYDR